MYQVRVNFNSGRTEDYYAQKYEMCHNFFWMEVLIEDSIYEILIPFLAIGDIMIIDGKS